MKNVLIISEVYKRGGSGNATEVVFKLFKKNFTTKLLLPYLNTKNDNIVNYYSYYSYCSYFIFKIFSRVVSYIFSNDKYYFFNNIFQCSLFSAKKIKKKLKNFKPDYVLILWYDYILNYKEILKIKNIFRAKIIIYPFDMHPFTGGCRYSQSCINYKNNCENCPAIKLSGIASKNYLFNQKKIKKINPLFFFPSDFSMNLAKESKIINDRVKKIKFYYPVNKKQKNTNYEPNLNQFKNYNLLLKNKKKYKHIVFCGSQNGNEWRKGIFFYKLTLNIFKNFYPETYKNTMFIYCGNEGNNLFNNPDSNFFIFDFLPYPEVIKIYKLSDVIVIPSIQEWSSFMMSDSLLLNKHTICFDTGSSKDYIKEELNGNICDPYNFKNTADILYKTLNKKNQIKAKNFFIAKVNDNNNKIISYLK